MHTPSHTQSSAMSFPPSGRGPMSYVGTLPGLQLIAEVAAKSKSKGTTYTTNTIQEHTDTDTTSDQNGDIPNHIGTSLAGPEQKICAYWYHGICTKDGSSPETTCRFLHQVERSSLGLSWQHRKFHAKKGCALELCLWKDGTKSQRSQKKFSDAVVQVTSKTSAPSQAATDQPDVKSKKRKKGKQVGRRDSVSDMVGAPPASLPYISVKGPKEKREWHTDAPVKRRRTELDYDGGEISAEQEQVKDKTCFWWYHGSKCPKEWDAARGLGPPCDYQHRMTDPPKMVQYPRSGGHDGIACGKQWCPIGRNSTDKHKHKHTNTPTYHQQNAESSIRHEKSASRPPPLDLGNPDSDTTCFFWYHGNCARSQDPRNAAGCKYLHGLTEPPSMVQPPPGYKHRSPCERDWCPGDAREAFCGGLRGAVPIGEESGSSEDIQDEEEAEKQDWFLKGFD